jgi:hypothetical protein
VFIQHPTPNNNNNKKIIFPHSKKKQHLHTPPPSPSQQQHGMNSSSCEEEERKAIKEDIEVMMMEEFFTPEKKERRDSGNVYGCCHNCCNNSSSSGGSSGGPTKLVQVFHEEAFWDAERCLATAVPKNSSSSSGLSGGDGTTSSFHRDIRLVLPFILENLPENKRPLCPKCYTKEDPDAAKFNFDTFNEVVTRALLSPKFEDFWKERGLWEDWWQWCHIAFITFAVSPH